MLGSASDAGLGSELEPALHRSGVHAVRSGRRVETRRHATGRGCQARAGCDLAVVPDGGGDPVADLPDSEPDAGRCWRERCRLAAPGIGPAPVPLGWYLMGPV